MRTVGKVVLWIYRIIIIAVVVFIIYGLVNFYLNRPAEPPTLAEAPWAVQTFSNDGKYIPSRFYLANKVEILEDGTPKITDYWTYDGKGYHHQDGERLFDKATYGNVDIKRRKE